MTLLFPPFIPSNSWGWGIDHKSGCVHVKHEWNSFPHLSLMWFCSEPQNFLPLFQRNKVKKICHRSLVVFNNSCCVIGIVEYIQKIRPQMKDERSSFEEGTWTCHDCLIMHSWNERNTLVLVNSSTGSDYWWWWVGERRGESVHRTLPGKRGRQKEFV